MSELPLQGDIALKVRNFVVSTMSAPKTELGRASLQKFVDTGRICLPNGEAFDVTSADPWSLSGSRATGRTLNGFLFVRDWIPWLDLEASSDDIVRVAALIRRWYEMHGTRTPQSTEMAFHDETTAQRLMTLLLLVQLFEKQGADSDYDFLLRLLRDTSDLLYSEDFHATGNNHGMFQDIALRNYALLATWQDTRLSLKFSRSVERLAEYFLTAFTVEGVHIENAPTYHLMIARTLSDHVEILEDLSFDQYTGELRSLLAKSAQYATHAVLPTGKFWPLSDTRQLSLAAARHNPFQSDEFEYAATQGSRGKKPTAKTLCLPRSGYFYSRSAWGDAKASYIGFVAAYNGNYHKHSDDLSVIVWRDGLPLITEAGPYGYDYKLPLTQYAYSQFAHNNVTVNGASVRRTDDAASTVWMREAVETGVGTVVQAGTGRLRDVFHERELTVAKDFTGMTVQDSLQSINRNTYDMHWNLAPDIRIVLHANGFEMFRGIEKVGDALVSSGEHMTVTAHRGETEPKVLGWSFPDFGKAEPATCVRIRIQSRDLVATTKFRFSAPFNYVDRGLNNDKSGWRVSETTPRLNFLLDHAESPSNTLNVVFTAMGQLGDFSYNYRRSAQSSRANVLYILDDFGDQGSYYWLQKLKSSPFAATQQLIRDVMAELGIPSVDNVATFGSSKGGAAALLHGSALGAGLMILGAPQYRIGSFVSKPHPNVLNYMTRGSSPAHVAWLDSAFESMLRSAQPAGRVSLFVGTSDHHYSTHVLPLQSMLEAKGWDTELLVQEGLNHAGVGAPYGTFISEAMSAFDAGKFESIGVTRTTLAAAGHDAVLTFDQMRGYRFTAKLYREQAQIDQVVIHGESGYVWKTLQPGRYRARLYGRYDDARLRPFTTRWVEIPG